MPSSNASERRLGKSEISLIKSYCSRVSDEDLSVLASSLPQSMMGDRFAACEIIQRDKEMDRWLVFAAGVDDWFMKIDSIGDFAVLEIQSRAKKSEN